MSDDPQDQQQFVPVRYIGAEGRIINGVGVTYGDIVSLPQEEVAAWPDAHPYYERADQASGDGRAASEEAGTAATPAAPSAPSEQLAAVKE